MENGEYVLAEYVSRFVDKLVRAKTICGFDKDLRIVFTRRGLCYKNTSSQFANFTLGKQMKESTYEMV